MSRLHLRAPSPALAVSLVALIVALGGTAYAGFSLPKNSVGTKQLKNNAVTTSKIKNGAVTASKISTSGLTVPAAQHASSADTATVANSLPALTWTTATLLNGWVNYGSASYGLPGLQYTKDAEGFVHLRGTLRGTSATSVIVASLPSGFRPPSGAWVPLGETNGAFDPFAEAAWIDSAGNIHVYAGTGANNDFVSFEGAEFYTG
jgi:hypothetical protein